MIAAAIGKIGVTELLVLLVIVLLIFGPKQLPKLARMFGKSVSSFKKGIENGLEEDGDEFAGKAKEGEKTKEAAERDAEDEG